MAAREAPAKWSLLGVNRKPELIEKRRRELEAWLWKLIADPRAARSRSLNNFLELSDVARVVTRCAHAGFRAIGLKGSIPEASTPSLYCPVPPVWKPGACRCIWGLGL